MAQQSKVHPSAGTFAQEAEGQWGKPGRPRLARDGSKASATGSATPRRPLPPAPARFEAEVLELDPGEWMGSSPAGDHSNEDTLARPVSATLRAAGRRVWYGRCPETAEGVLVE